MCVSPIFLKNGREVACRKCWQCNENRVNDWVGRCIAEGLTAVGSHSVTLTYGRDEGGSWLKDSSDHLRAAVLTYSDVQKMLKHLRSDGFPVRYFAVGEYGAMKGRSHWHAMLFWQDRVPPHEMRERFAFPWWPHGLAFFDEMSGPSVRYVCKYLQKDLRAAERQGHLAMSKKPPLGAKWFAMRAAMFVDQGLSPQDAFYSFPGMDAPTASRPPGRRPSRTARYLLRGRSLDLFCEAFVAEWVRRHPGRWWPHSELIEEYCDRVAGPALSDPDLVRRRMGGRPWIEPPAGSSAPVFSEPHNTWWVSGPDGRKLWWSHDIYGARSWESEIRTEAGSATARRAAIQYREASAGMTDRRLPT